MIFCDTSTLAKYYVPEAESGLVRERLDAEDQVVLSDLARAELMGVFHRRMRERKWKSNQFLAAARQFSADEARGFWTWVPLDGAIIQQVVRAYATLPQDVLLRAADCLHLVTALQQGFTEIHTHDGHQRDGARALGVEPVTIQ